MCENIWRFFMKCPYCWWENPDGAKFYEYCKSKLPPQKDSGADV